MTDYYESDAARAQYLWLHYGEPVGVIASDSPFAAALHFPERCVELLLRGARTSGARALDVGCAVGRSTFELARVCASAIGIDYSAPFIAAAERLRMAQSIDYSTPSEGDLIHMHTARRPDGVDPTRVRFEVGDAMALRADLGAFEFVLAANLICRLYEPMKFLARLPELVQPGGRLLLTTPATWKQIYTPRENWIGGFEREAGPLRTLDGLHAALSPWFDLELREDLPLLIPEHARKFELIIAEATRWRRV